MILLVVTVASSAGCTSVQLRHSTVEQIATITDLQHKIVLHNLAAVSCNPDAIPFQANLENGTTQVADSAFAQYLKQWSAGIGLSALTFGASRDVVDQWGLTPVTDEITLRMLRIAYRRALGYEEDLYTTDLANSVAQRLKTQINVAPDVQVGNALMFARGPALPQLLDRPGWAGDRQVGFRADDRTVQRWQKDTNDIISSNSARIVQEGERLTRANLGVTPVLVRGMPYVVQGENSPRVMIATPYAAEVRRQVLEINDYLLEINPGWLCTGCKHDVPKCACYVGHHKECEGKCYVWVGPEGRQAFEDFTLRTLRLISLVQKPGGPSQPQGLMFSPSTN